MATSVINAPTTENTETEAQTVAKLNKLASSGGPNSALPKLPFNNSDPSRSLPANVTDLTIKANPLREYVAVGGDAYISAYYSSLPQWIDDITSDFGTDTYERMMLDPEVFASIEYLKMSVLANGIKVTGRIDDEKDADYQQSQYILDFVLYQLFDRVETPITTVCHDLLGALEYGNRVAELIYEPEDDQTHQYYGKVCLKAIKLKPRESVAFVVDSFMNVQAVQGLLPGVGNTTLLTQGFVGLYPPTTEAQASEQILGSYKDPVTGQVRIAARNILPRQKFVIHSSRMYNNDPRGTSLLRSAYNAWWRKAQVEFEQLKYISQFATPSLIVNAAPDAQPVYDQDGYGNLRLDSNGQPVTISPESLAANALANLKNSSVVGLPANTPVNALTVTNDGSAFINMLQTLNAAINKAILFQTLATSEGLHDSRAASDTHADVLAMAVRFYKQELAETLLRDVVGPLVKYNFGVEAFRRFCPRIILPETEAKDVAALGAAIAQLTTSGYLDQTQFPKIDALLNLPVRDLEAIAARQAEEQQQALDNQKMQLEMIKTKAEADAKASPLAQTVTANDSQQNQEQKQEGKATPDGSSNGE